MATFIYINPDPSSKDRATTLGCGWMASVPAQYAAVATAPCAIVSGAGQTIILPEPTTAQAVAAAAAPILAAEQAAAQAQATRNANADTLRTRAQAAISTNDTYLAQPPIPASPTNAQLIAAVKVIRTQLDATTRQNNALIRLALGSLDDISDT